MNQWTKKISTTVTATVALLCGGCGQQQTQQPQKTQVIGLSHITSPGSAWDKGAHKFAELVAERSNGRFQVKVYPLAELAQGNQKTELQQLCAGTIDMTLHSPIILALHLDKRFDAFSLPWLFPDHEVANAVCDGPFGDRAIGWLEEHGVHGIAYGVNGFRQLTNSVRDVTKPEDLADMKVRVAGTDLFRRVFSEFGASPTTMNFGELFIALQQGALDAQENPLSIIYSSKLYEVQDHVTVWNYAYDPLILTYNKKLWDKLPAADQELFTQCGKEAMAWQRDLVAREDRELIDKLAEKGMAITVLTPEQTEQFRVRCAGIYQEFAPKIGAEIVTEVQAEVERVEKQRHDRSTKQTN